MRGSFVFYKDVRGVDDSWRMLIQDELMERQLEEGIAGDMRRVVGCGETIDGSLSNPAKNLDGLRRRPPSETEHDVATGSGI